MTYGDKLFGLNDIKVLPHPTGSAVDLPAAQQMSLRLSLLSGELRGDDAIVAIASFIEGGEFTLQAGGISLEAYAVLTGRTPVTAGSSPNETKTLTLTGDDSLPYFRVYGKSLGDSGDIHVKLYKCKLTGLEGTFQGGQFFISSASGRFVKDTSVSKAIDYVQNETATALPSS